MLVFSRKNYAHRRPKPLKIMAFLSNYDCFCEELSQFTNLYEGQNFHSSLWFDCQASWKIVHKFAQS